MSIASIKGWFNAAVPEPTDENFNAQLGCHVEEFVEMLESLKGENLESDEKLNAMISLNRDFAVLLKGHATRVRVVDRIEFLDAICDQIVTGVGAAAYQRMDIESALDSVNASNWSKFDQDGNPIFNENKKIIKGSNYFKPDLSLFV